MRVGYTISQSLVRRCLFISSRLGLELGLGLRLVVGLGLGLIIPTCHPNLVLRVIWQYDIFGMSHASSRRPEMRLLSVTSLLCIHFTSQLRHDGSLPWRRNHATDEDGRVDGAENSLRQLLYRLAG